ncbi:hypothetical protein NBZ79_03795 [Sneathiella marina]|uniref:Uncharacterized protein n=1 Tax=Sneathiella marina TaxID=2950108 RepID=A0ABY4WBR4_9PROT|nr:hypothetical protein [Sneathiella marina]USG62096.1 hypothetical protein NBZ79_03795 [Sneathiella marina]
MADFWLGVIGGAIGVVVGGAGQFTIDHLRHQRKTKAQRELDTRRKALLQTALENPPADTEWRKLTTLSRIIGADYETTTRLLIELGARGSEGEEDVWALLDDKPLRKQAD